MNPWNPVPIDPDIRAAMRRIHRARLANVAIACLFGVLAFAAGGCAYVAMQVLTEQYLGWHDVPPASRDPRGLVPLFVFVYTCRAAALFLRRARPEDVALVGQDVP